MKLNCRFIINTVAGEQIAVPVGKDTPFKGYIKLNSTARDIFELLNRDISREEIISEMSKIYPDTEPSEIESSVDGLIEKLNSAGLLV